MEDRFKEVLAQLASHPQSLLVIENFHRVEDKQSLLSGIVPIIKRQLSKNAMQLVCTATIDGYTKDIEKDKELLSYFEKVNVDEQPELARQFGVMSIPMLVVMKNGKIMQQSVGVQPKEAILRMI